MTAFAPPAGVLRECRERWGLVPDGAFALTYRYVEPARRADGSAAVLKLGPPADAQFELELDALEWFSGRGAVRVLAVDRPLGAALLERALPGTPLRGLPEDAAVAAAAHVMRQLWRPPDGAPPFPTVRHWGRWLTGRAGGLFAELCDSMAEPVVLHGDLHHDNLLRAGDGWLAIDAKGVIGEPAYELGALLRNPRPGLFDLPDPGRVLQRRSAQLAEALGFDVDRVRGWAYAQAELSAVWSVQDGEDPAFALAAAALLEPLTRGR
jgi:streptomycin 6-kinase